MVAGGLIFLGICLIFAAFIIVSVRIFQINRQFVLKLLKYGLIFSFGVAFTIASVAIGVRIKDRHESVYYSSLKSVQDIWGGEVTQGVPSFYYPAYESEEYQDEQTGQYRTRQKKVFHYIAFKNQDIKLKISSNIRKKGLLYFPGFHAEFEASYKLVNTFDTPKACSFFFPLPEGAGNITDIAVRMDNEEFTGDRDFADGISWTALMAPGEERLFTIQYTAQGTDSFSYLLGSSSVAIENLQFEMESDFKDIRIPNMAMVPDRENSDDEITRLVWEGKNLVSRQNIATRFKIERNHGELVAKMFFYSPLSIFLFIGFLLILVAAYSLDLHPMHYLFIITSFFIFYLFFSYVVSYVPVILGVTLSALLSTAIALYYTFLLKKGKTFVMSLATGFIIFQWLFSAAFFFREHTGFIITIASIVAFVILMRSTARVEWNDKW